MSCDFFFAIQPVEITLRGVMGWLEAPLPFENWQAVLLFTLLIVPGRWVHNHPSRRHGG